MNSLDPETPETSAGVAEDQRGALSMAEILEILVRRWNVWFGIAVGAAVLSVVVSLLLTPLFRSYVSFVPEAGNQDLPQLGGFLQEQASGLGIDVGGSAGQSAVFYVDLLRSRSVRSAVVNSEYESPDGEFSGDLVEFFRLDELEPRARAVDKAIETLAGRTSISHDGASGIVTLSVETRDPHVSRQIAHRYQEELESFNRQRRSIRTREQVRFLQTQLATARQELKVAEDSLEDFLAENRGYEQSPQLRFQKNRLDRRVSIRVGIVNRLQQQLEQAQLDLLAATPTVSIIDSPVVPQDKSRPKRTLIVLASTFLGGILGLVCTFMLEGWDRTYRRLSPDVQARLRSLVARARDAVGRVVNR